jgi:predicted nucleotidyltransferase
MQYGLENKVLKMIINCIAKYSEVEDLILFGSRAYGNYKIGSDIDLAIKGKIEFPVFLKIKSELEDLNLIYFIDLINYDDINNDKLIEEIDKKGVLLYSNESIIV